MSSVSNTASCPVGLPKRKPFNGVFLSMLTLLLLLPLSLIVAVARSSSGDGEGGGGGGASAWRDWEWAHHGDGLGRETPHESPFWEPGAVSGVPRYCIRPCIGQR